MTICIIMNHEEYNKLAELRVLLVRALTYNELLADTPFPPQMLQDEIGRTLERALKLTDKNTLSAAALADRLRERRLS